MARANIGRRIWPCVIGVAVGLVGWAGYAFTSALSTSRDYDSVTTFCNVAATPCGDTGALWLPATVTATGSNHSGRSTTYWVEFTDIALDGTQHVNLSGGGGVRPLIHAGDQVLVTEWHSRFTEVSNGDVTSKTADNPDIVTYHRVQMLVGTVFLAALLSMIGGLRRRRPARRIVFFALWLLLADAAYFAVLSIAKQALYLPALYSLALVGTALYVTGLAMRPVLRRRRGAAARLVLPEPSDAQPLDVS